MVIHAAQPSSYRTELLCIYNFFEPVISNSLVQVEEKAELPELFQKWLKNSTFVIACQFQFTTIKVQKYSQAIFFLVSIFYRQTRVC